MQKTPFRVELQDSAGAAFTTRGQKFWSSGYWEEDDGGLQIAGELLKLPEVLTESETYVGDPVNLEISEAELRHSLQPDDLWKLHLKRNRSTGEIMEELDAYLSNGTRIISIKGPTGADPSDTPATRPGFSYYEFTEDGIPIARASRQQSWTLGLFNTADDVVISPNPVDASRTADDDAVSVAPLDDPNAILTTLPPAFQITDAYPNDFTVADLTNLLALESTEYWAEL